MFTKCARAHDQHSIYSMVQKFCPDYWLLLELHTLTLVTCSYAFVLRDMANGRHYSPLHSPHSNSYLIVGFIPSSNSTRCNDHCRVGDCSQQWEHNTTNDGCWQTQVQQQLGTVWSGGIENRKISHCVQTGEKSGVPPSVPSKIASQ